MSLVLVQVRGLLKRGGDGLEDKTCPRFHMLNL